MAHWLILGEHVVVMESTEAPKFITLCPQDVDTSAPANRAALHTLLTAFHRPPSPPPRSDRRDAVAPTCQQRAVPHSPPSLSCSPRFPCSRAEQLSSQAKLSSSSRRLVQVNKLFCANYCCPPGGEGLTPHLGCLFCCGFWLQVTRGHSCPLPRGCFSAS